MTFASAAAPGAYKRFTALSAVACLAILPLLLTAGNVAIAVKQVAANRDLSRMLVELQGRLDGAGGGGAAEEAGRSLFEGETVGVAGAALQADVAAIVESADANTVELELLDPEEGGDPRELRLRITFEARNDALQRILLAVEGDAKALYVRSLSIEVAGDAAMENGPVEPSLRATAVIEGYWREVRR